MARLLKVELRRTQAQRDIELRLSTETLSAKSIEISRLRQELQQAAAWPSPPNSGSVGVGVGRNWRQHQRQGDNSGHHNNDDLRGSNSGSGDSGSGRKHIIFCSQRRTIW